MMRMLGLTAATTLLGCWAFAAQAQSVDCNTRQAADLEPRLKQRFGVWAGETPGEALRWAQRLDRRRDSIEREGHNACTLYRQLLDELDRMGVAG